MRLVMVTLFVCLSLTETRSTEKGDKTLPDKTDPPEHCRNEIVFFLSVLRICNTYRRILYSKSRVKNWAGLDKNIQAALHIADSKIHGGKPDSRKDGSKKDGSGSNGSKEQSDSDNDPETFTYQDMDFGTDVDTGFFYNEGRSGDSDEDGMENLDDDGTMDEESSSPPELSAAVIRALRHLEQPHRQRQERAAGKRRRRRPPYRYRQLGFMCGYLGRRLY